MPKIDKILSLEITPEQFLNSCSINELLEIELLIDSAIRRKRNQSNKEIHVDSETMAGYEERWDAFAVEQIALKEENSKN